MLREALFTHRSGPACRSAGGVLSWAELHGRAARLAGFLRAQGVRRLVLYGPAGARAMTAIAACLLAGVTYIPVDADTPPERLRSICAQSAADALLALDGEPAAAGLPVLYAWNALPAAPPLTVLPPVSESDIAYILFTSGSTGTPRGVCVTYGNLENFLRWFLALPAVAAAPPHTVRCAARFSFDLSVAALYPVFALGGCLEPGPPDAAGAAELLVCTPSALDLWLLDEDFGPARLPALRAVFCCGEVLRPATVRRLWQRFAPRCPRVLNAYGPTEATCAVSAAEIQPAMLALPALPIGRAAGEAVDITVEDGCLCLSGPSVAAGYLGEAPFQGRFLTADRGAVHDGLLWFLGRADDQLKYKGYRIEPAGIEAALCRAPGVHAAAVVPRRTADGRVTALIAYAAADKTVTEAALRRALAAMLPAYMLPRQILLSPALPLTANGKIDRRKLSEC